MSIDMHHQIRERAYHLWVASGHRDDLSHEHWLQAEREMSRPVIAAPAAKATARKPAAKAAKPAAAAGRGSRSRPAEGVSPRA